MIWLLACEAERPPARGDTTGQVATVERTLASCAEYRQLPEVYGVCLAERVMSLGSAAEVGDLCPQAGRWEEACRQAWVDHQVRMHSAVSRTDLLAACGPNADCAFQLLEASPAADVLDQIRACETYVRAYESDCIGHALHRWVDARPPATDAERVLTGAPGHAPQIASFLGMSEGCGGTMACAGDDTLVALCRSSAETYRQNRVRCRNEAAPRR